MNKTTSLSPEFRNDIQGLRGIAILLVVFYHAGGLFRGGFIGVDVFFVISGFVITSSLLRRLREHERIGLIEFYGRRIRRLLPALAAMLVVVIGMSTWFSAIAARTQTVRTGGFATFSIANLYLYRFRPDGYFEKSEKTNALIHAWSLSLEEQFYLLFPLLLLLSIWLARRSSCQPIKILQAFSFGVGIASLIVCIIASNIEISNLPALISNKIGTDVIDQRFAFYLPFGRAWEFLAGVWLATLNRQTKPKTDSRFRAHIGIGFIVASALFFAETTRFPGIFALLPIVGASLVIHNRNESGFIYKILTSRCLRWLGDRSYGWYLWHWPLIQFIRPFWPDNILAATGAGFLRSYPRCCHTDFWKVLCGG